MKNFKNLKQNFQQNLVKTKESIKSSWQYSLVKRSKLNAYTTDHALRNNLFYWHHYQNERKFLYHVSQASKRSKKNSQPQGNRSWVFQGQPTIAVVIRDAKQTKKPLYYDVLLQPWECDPRLNDAILTNQQTRSPLFSQSLQSPPNPPLFLDQMQTSAEQLILVLYIDINICIGNLDNRQTGNQTGSFQPPDELPDAPDFVTINAAIRQYSIIDNLILRLAKLKIEWILAYRKISIGESLRLMQKIGHLVPAKHIISEIFPLCGLPPSGHLWPILLSANQAQLTERMYCQALAFQSKDLETLVSLPSAWRKDLLALLCKGNASYALARQIINLAQECLMRRMKNGAQIADEIKAYRHSIRQIPSNQIHGRKNHQKAVDILYQLKQAWFSDCYPETSRFQTNTQNLVKGLSKDIQIHFPFNYEGDYGQINMRFRDGQHLQSLCQNILQITNEKDLSVGFDPD